MSSPLNTDPPPGGGYTTMPKWVKWSLIAVVALVVLAIFAALVLGGDHGPGRHASTPVPVTHDVAGVVLTRPS